MSLCIFILRHIWRSVIQKNIRITNSVKDVNTEQKFCALIHGFSPGQTKIYTAQDTPYSLKVKRSVLRSWEVFTGTCAISACDPLMSSGHHGAQETNHHNLCRKPKEQPSLCLVSESLEVNSCKVPEAELFLI